MEGKDMEWKGNGTDSVQCPIYLHDIIFYVNGRELIWKV